MASWYAMDVVFPVDLEYHKQSTVVLSKEGETLRHFPDSSGVWRYPLDLNEVSPYYLEALIGYEDRWFWHHPGINPAALVRAAFQALKYGEIVSGGSTLTMQVARMHYSTKRSVLGKLHEMVLAVQLERHYSKQDILRYYLNHAPFGGTIEGVQAAALSYFGYDASVLTRAQAALLAVLPQAPSRFRPDRHPEVAEAARNKLLDRLVTFNIWSNNTVLEAKREQVIASQISRFNSAPLLSRRLHNASEEQRIQSTIDFRLQLAIEQRVKQTVQLIDEQASAAVLVMNSQTGSVVAYAGSADFHDDQRSGHVDMIQSIRSPGSTLKPFVYGLAIDRGLIHSDSLLMDVPLRFGDYQPENFLGGFSGPVSVRTALQKSLNLPAVQVLEQLGPNDLYVALQQAGAQLVLPPGSAPNLSIVLGGIGSNLESLVTLYSALGRDGTTIKPRYTEQDPEVSMRLISTEAAWIVRKILFDNPHTPGVALKTGTSYGYRDVWSLAVVGDYTLGVWLGKPDGTPMVSHFGSHTATPLLLNVIDIVSDRQGLPTQPETVVEKSICWPTGQSETPDLCDERLMAYTINGITPQTFMNIKADQQTTQRAAFTGQVSHDSRELVPFGCEVPSKTVRFAVWPGPLQHWIPAHWRHKVRMPNIDRRCPSQWAVSTALPISIEGIQDGDVRMVTNHSNSTLRLTAVGGQAPFTWYINGVVTNKKDELYYLTLTPLNDYQVVVVDRNGNNDAVHFSTASPP